MMPTVIHCANPSFSIVKVIFHLVYFAQLFAIYSDMNYFGGRLINTAKDCEWITQETSPKQSVQAVGHFIEILFWAKNG